MLFRSKIRKSELGKARSRFGKYSGQNIQLEAGEDSEEDSISPLKHRDSSNTKKGNSPRISEMVQRHSSAREPGTIKTVSSIDFPANSLVPSNANLSFIRGHEKLM